MLTRVKLEALAWKHTHRDFRGKDENGAKSVLIFRPGIGTCSVPLSSFKDDELWGKVPAAVRSLHGE